MNARPTDNDWFKLDVLWKTKDEILYEKMHLMLGGLLAGLFFIAIVVFTFLEILIVFK